METEEEATDQTLVIDDLDVDRFDYYSEEGRVFEPEVFILNFPLGYRQELLKIVCNLLNEKSFL